MIDKNHYLNEWRKQKELKSEQTLRRLVKENQILRAELNKALSTLAGHNVNIDRNGLPKFELIKDVQTTKRNSNKNSDKYSDWWRERSNLPGIKEDTVPNKKPDYNEYIKYMESLDWYRNFQIIDQDSKEFTVHEQYNVYFIDPDKIIKKGEYGIIVSVKCPKRGKMSIMGLQHVPPEKDSNSAYSLGLHIVDKENEEIPDNTVIRLVKESINDIVQLDRVPYSKIKIKNKKSTYQLKQGVEFNNGDYLVMGVIDSPCDIPIKNVEFKIEIDIWRSK